MRSPAITAIFRPGRAGTASATPTRMISTIVLEPMALLAAWGVVAVGVLATLSAMMAGDPEALDAEGRCVPEHDAAAR